ncbi:MAG: Phage Tail Collar [Parcubacteria group bacterium]|nr:Phage Tail Collar [Parcubacteria group bacterium]
MGVDQAIATLVDDLPRPVREFVLGPERDRISLSLTQKYSLHADQAAAFEQTYLFLLLGVSSPEEFAQALKNAGISEETVLGLTNDINEQVFKPLRAKIQESTGTPPDSSAPAIPAPVIPSTSGGASAVSKTPIPVAPPLPPPPIPRPISAPPAMPIARPVPPPLPPPPPAVPLYDTEPAMRTMATDMQAAKEHRVPEPLFSRPAPAAPLAPVVAAPLPPPVEPPAPHRTMSSIVPPPLPHVYEPPAASRAPLAPPPPNLPGAPTAPPYSVDPYREPME